MLSCTRRWCASTRSLRVPRSETPDPDEGEQPIDSSDMPSAELVRRAADGDARAFEHLFVRFRPALRRWATGRLPHWARDLVDTDDMIQETFLRTFRNLHSF